MRLIFAIIPAIAFSAGAQPPPDESDPLIASVMVYSQAYSVERWEAYCAKVDPESAPVITEAGDKWLLQHSDLIEKASRILQTQYTKEQRIEIAVQAKLANNESEDRLSAATPEARKRWCRETPFRIADQGMNLMARPVLVKAVTGFELNK